MRRGCGDSPDQDLTEGLSASELLERSTEAFQEQHAYRIALTSNVDAEGIALESDSVLDLLGGIGTISGEGPVVGQDLALDISADLGPFTAQANVTRVDGDLYLDVVGRTFHVLAGESVIGADITALPDTLLGWVEDPQEVGPVRPRRSTDRSRAHRDRSRQRE